MKAIVRAIKWLLTVLLVLAVIGGVCAYWLLTHNDELVRKQVADHLSRLAPGWQFRIGRANFDFIGHIRVYDLSVTVPGESTPILTLPETVVTVDRDLLFDRREIRVLKVRMLKPQLELHRGPQGVWNWQRLPIPRPRGRKLPELEFELGQIRLRFDQPDGSAPAIIHLSDVAASVSSNAKTGNVELAATTTVQQAGGLSLSGQLDPDEKTWNVDGEFQNLTVSPLLVRTLARCSPQLDFKLAEVGDLLSRYKTAVSKQHGIPAAPVSLAGDAAPLPINAMALESRTETTAGGLPDFGIQAVVNLNFRLTCTDPQSKPELKLLAAIQSGQITNSLLPFPLFDLQGKVFTDNEQLILRELRAENGTARLWVDGVLRRGAQSRLDVNLSGISLDDRLRSRLPASWRKVYDDLNLAGKFDAQVVFESDGGREWEHAVDLQPRGCTLSHKTFAYPVEAVTGTVKKRGSRVDVDLQGRAGQRPITIGGVIHDPGPAAHAVFDVQVEQAPFDNVFLSACPEQVRHTIESLNLKGAADYHLRLVRPAGVGQKFEPELGCRLRNCSMSFDGFRYRLTELNGLVTLKDDVWTFRELRARHDETSLTGWGNFSLDPPPGRLELNVDAVEARFDKQLELALPESMQRVWNEVSPGGVFNLQTRIEWTPGRPPTVLLPKVDVVDGEMLLAAFPYSIEDVVARMSYENGLLTIESFHGNHDEAKVRLRGFGQFYESGSWRIVLDDLHVDDLTLRPAFRRALPESLRSVVEELDPRGTFSISPGAVEFRSQGGPRDPVLSAWDLNVVLSGVSFWAGLRVEDANGKVHCQGFWDGQYTQLTGKTQADSLTLLGYQFTKVRGPITLHRGELVVGSRDVVYPPQESDRIRRATIDDRLSGRLIDGRVTLDAVVQVGEDPKFRLVTSLSRESLDKYARRYIGGGSNLHGTINGWMTLGGRGYDPDDITGKGQLQILDAALYELPIIVQIFSVIGFVPPERSAFNYADLSFDVSRSRFNFRSIDLVGNAITLRGRGYMRFDGGLMLDFYSMLSRSQFSIFSLPFVHEVVEGVSRGWVGVRVRGNINNTPIVEQVPVPQIDDALKQFLGAFEPRRPPPIPTFAPQPYGPPRP